MTEATLDNTVPAALGADAIETTPQKSAAIAALETEFSGLINHFHRIISENANRLSPGMLPGAYKTFTTIVRQGPLTSSALAETLEADKGLISRTVRELEERELIERTPDPNDGRSSLLAATPAAVAKLNAAREPGKTPLMVALREWDTEQIEALTHLLHALGEGKRPHRQFS